MPASASFLTGIESMMNAQWNSEWIMDRDQHYMKQVLELGEKVKGSTGDNPWVGCVIVRKDQILGRGTTHPPGGPHAEVAAMDDASSLGNDLAGATLYSTVEPCSFHGRTPSCADDIADSGIIRVVSSLRDPHPCVNGEGFRILREAGIEISEGVSSDRARELLESWLQYFDCNK